MERPGPAQESSPGVQDRPVESTGIWSLLKWLRWPVALAVVGFWVWLLAVIVAVRPHEHARTFEVPFEKWYGNWSEVLVVSTVFLAFVLGLLWPRGKAQWRNAGIYSAFLISLFVEMFGVPLTIFLLAPLLDLPALAFGQSESHLWAFLLDRAGIVPLAWGVYFVMTSSLALIAAGMALLALGWAQVFGARYGLQTRGIYAFVRHPQYLGLMLIVLAFNIQWPTLPTLAMAPVLIVLYVRQARREEGDLEGRCGDEFVRYAASVPAFIPRLRSRPCPGTKAREAQ